MIELTYEQRMALFDVIAELKTGIVCEECGNNIWPSDLCLTPQLEQLQTILDNAVVIDSRHMITMSSMDIKRFLAEVEKTNAEIKRLKHELIRNRALFMVCRDKILEKNPGNEMLIIAGMMDASYEKYDDAERELEGLKRMS